MIAFYATQLHLLARWTGGRAGVVRRGAATLTIAMLALVVTAWLIPGITLRDIPSGVMAALGLAAMRTLLRPVLIAYLSQVSIAVATIVTVIVQALAFWLIAQAGWIAVDRPVDAVIGSVLFSIGNALVTAVLSTGDDNSFFGTLVRQLAARHRKTDVTKEPGVVFIQIDGLSHPILEEHLREFELPMKKPAVPCDQVHGFEIAGGDRRRERATP